MTQHEQNMNYASSMLTELEDYPGCHQQMATRMTKHLHIYIIWKYHKEMIIDDQVI